MWRAYSDMLEANYKNSDKYFHARGNYDAARRGPGGAWAAKVIRYLGSWDAGRGSRAWLTLGIRRAQALEKDPSGLRAPHVRLCTISIHVQRSLRMVSGPVPRRDWGWALKVLSTQRVGITWG